MNNLQRIQEQLTSKADPSNLEFFSRMVPGEQKMYGVKTPDLNDIAGEFKTGGFELVKALWDSGALEEKIIAIKILEQIGKTDVDRTLQIFKSFANNIENWAVCDGLATQALKGPRKTRVKEIFELAKQYNRDSDPWKRRLSLVMVEWFTRDARYHKEISRLVKNLENDKEYYVKKAIQWINRNLSKNK